MHRVNSPSDPDFHAVSRSVCWNELVWTAGHSLASGGFLLYFAREFGASSAVIALLLVIPETAGISSLLTRHAITRLGGRKRLWLGCTITSRLLLLGIPLAGVLAVLRPHASTGGFSAPLVLIAVSLAAASLVNAVGYVAFVSWVSDLVPEQRWGRFFALRQIVRLGVMLTVPIAGGFLRDWWKQQELSGAISSEKVLLLYVAAFVLGVGLTLLSVWPLRHIPDVGTPATGPASRRNFTRTGRQIVAAFRHRSLRFLLLHAWWLSAANGLTQAAFFGWLFGPLKVGLGMFYLLLAVMQLVQIPVSHFAGIWSDRHGDRNLLALSLLVASCALPCWLLSSPEAPGWIYLAYALFGAFAAANIAGRNLLLRLAPRSDNTIPLTLFRQVSGLIAGLSGLAGGFWLDHLHEAETVVHLGSVALGPFQLLFVISWIGRVTAILWLWPIAEPARQANHPGDEVSSSATG